MFPLMINHSFQSLNNHLLEISQEDTIDRVINGSQGEVRALKRLKDHGTLESQTEGVVGIE